MINVILVDDHQVVLDGLQQLLKDVLDIKVIDTASNGKQLLQKLSENNEVDVVLMDVTMPIMNGIEATALVKEQFPTIKVLMLTMRAEQKTLNQALEAGANGYLTKNKGKSDFIEAIRQVHDGDRFIKMADIDNEEVAGNNSNNPFTSLNERELQIICLITRQYTSKEIVKTLSISRLTLEVSKRTILKKLGVRNDAGIVMMAIKHQLCSLKS